MNEDAKMAALQDMLEDGEEWFYSDSEMLLRKEDELIESDIDGYLGLRDMF